MKRSVLLLVLMVTSAPAFAQVPVIDFETPPTGSNIIVDGSITTPAGTISLYEQTPGDASINGFGSFPNDLPEGTYGNRLVEAGSSGSVGLDFDFDVLEITFNFGGDGGGFEAQVLDGSGAVLDSITIADLPASGLAPGPTTLSGTAIRSLRFEDPIGGAAIDNLIIVTDPVVYTNAIFYVTKVFTDGNTADVDVTLTCNGGLPLSQDFTIAGGDPAGVMFTVTDIPDIGINCTVTESGGPAGYTASFDNGSTVSDTSCLFEDTAAGNYTCEITNTPDPTEISVNTTFVNYPNDDVASDVDTSFETVLNCSDVSSSPSGPFGSEQISTSDAEFTASWYVAPGETAECTVTLYPDSDAVEGDSCAFSFVTGDAEAGCDVVGTVFFEGVPTLNQYGLAIMALLMLGVGFIGFRRFV